MGFCRLRLILKAWVFLAGDVVIGVEPEKQLILIKRHKITEGRFLAVGDGYRAVLGSSVAREFNLKAGDETPDKEQARAARLINNPCEEFYSCWSNGIHGFFL